MTSRETTQYRCDHSVIMYCIITVYKVWNFTNFVEASAQVLYEKDRILQPCLDLTVLDIGLKISVNKGFDFFSGDLFSCFDSYVTLY